MPNPLQITDPNADSDNPLVAGYGGAAQPHGRLEYSEDLTRAIPMPLAGGGNALLKSGPAAGRVPRIEVSGGPLRGQSNIVRFTEDADAIQAALPPVPEGHTRLWRGNRPGEVGANPQFTNSLEGIALPFREAYGGPVSYVDVPSADVGRYLNTAGAAHDSEFSLPPDLASQAKAIHVAPRAEPGARKGQ